MDLALNNLQRLFNAIKPNKPDQINLILNIIIS